MVIRVGDLIESILKQREQFLSITNDEVDVIAIKSANLYEDLIFILDNVPSTLIHGMSISDDNIYITVRELSTDDIDLDIQYIRENSTFSVSISSNKFNDFYREVDTIEEFLKFLGPNEPGIELKLHPYGIVSSRNTLATYGTFLSFVYPVPIDFTDIEPQYVYLFRNRYKFIHLLGFHTTHLSGSCYKIWTVPNTYYDIDATKSIEPETLPHYNNEE